MWFVFYTKFVANEENKKVEWAGNFGVITSFHDAFVLSQEIHLRRELRPKISFGLVYAFGKELITVLFPFLIKDF